MFDQIMARLKTPQRSAPPTNRGEICPNAFVESCKAAHEVIRLIDSLDDMNRAAWDKASDQERSRIEGLVEKALCGNPETSDNETRAFRMSMIATVARRSFSSHQCGACQNK